MGQRNILQPYENMVPVHYTGGPLNRYRKSCRQGGKCFATGSRVSGYVDDDSACTASPGRTGNFGDDTAGGGTLVTVRTEDECQY